MNPASTSAARDPREIPAAQPAPSRLERAQNVFDDMDSLVAEHQVRIFRFLLLSLRDNDLAQTMTQETFLRAWTARASFRGDCSPRTWLMRIAINLVRDHTRTGRFRFWKNVASTSVDVTEVSSLLPATTNSAELSLIQHEQLKSIWETVSTLSERQRTIFMLRFVEELDLAEIADATNIPVSTVKSHLYRAINTVRARYQDNSK